MTASHRRLAIAAAVLLPCALVIAFVTSREPAPAERPVLLTPAYAARLGSGGDPLVVVVAFPWSEDGFCSGQFRVTAQETPTQIVVNQVEAWPVPEGSECAGVGTTGGMAGDYLTLKEPLGNRAVIRAVDGIPLEVRDP